MPFDCIYGARNVYQTGVCASTVWILFVTVPPFRNEIEAAEKPRFC